VYIRPLNAEADGADWMEAALLALEFGTKTRPQMLGRAIYRGPTG